MVHKEFAQGDKVLGIIIGAKYYSYSEFIGKYFGIPLKRHDPNTPKKMITISTYERMDGKKLKKAEIKPQVDDLLECCDTMGITVLLVVSSDYFKYLTGEKALEESIGLTYRCCLAGYEHITILPCINPAVISAQPNKQGLLDKSIEVCGQVLAGTYVKPIDHQFEFYEMLTGNFEYRLRSLLQYPYLAADIETTGLRVGETEILTIAFAWDEYNAITLPVHPKYGFGDNREVLRQFLEAYKGSLIWHNCLFDLKHLIYNLYMDDFSDLEGIYRGCEALGVERAHDTMLLAYAELNSTERPPLGLKVLAKEFLGKWALDDVHDCNGIPLEDLAFYNTKDTAGTFYLFNKYNHQLNSRIYTEILQPSIEYLLHEMLNGVPIDMDSVDSALGTTEEILATANMELKDDPFVMEAVELLKLKAVSKYNKEHKKQKTVDDFDIEFNPNSAAQLQVLLFQVMEFEPVEFTDGGAPKTDRGSLQEFKSLLKEDSPKLRTLNALQAISETAIVQNTFLAAFKELSILDKTGTYTLHGNHRLGAVLSGRLSSNQPNMANSPSSSRFGGLIKQCFKAPKGWLYFYADYNSLEDRISTALANDRMKLKELLEGYDGHSLRAHAFFKEELEERGLFLDPNDPASINRIQTEAKDLRQDAKPISFLKVYGGGAGKIQKVLKCSLERAQSISSAYDELYCDTFKFNETNIARAKKDGYLDVAFGLRVKCPRINSRDTCVSAAEGRSVNNAVSQSYGMLTNLASIKLLSAIKASEYRNDIKLINQVHDCVYGLVREDTKAVKWVNDTLIPIMRWKDDPAIRDSTVTMEAELDVGYDGKHCHTIPNGVSQEFITTFCEKLQEGDESVSAWLKSQN